MIKTKTYSFTITADEKFLEDFDKQIAEVVDIEQPEGATIMQLLVHGDRWTRFTNGLYGVHYGSHTIAEVYKQFADVKILSIQRKSDLSIFTVIDDYIEYTYRPNGSRRLDSIKIINGEVVLFTAKDPGDPSWFVNRVLLRNARKARKPLYTTEDGFILYDKSEYANIWGVAIQASGSDMLREGTKIFLDTNDVPKSTRKWFYHKDNAISYLVQHAPILSYSEIKQCCIYPGDTVLLEKLTAKVKEKLDIK